MSVMTIVSFDSNLSSSATITLTFVFVLTLTTPIYKSNTPAPMATLAVGQPYIVGAVDRVAHASTWDLRQNLRTDLKAKKIAEKNRCAIKANLEEWGVRD